MPVQRGEPERHVVDRDDADGAVPGAGHMDHVVVDPRHDDGRGRARERRAARALRRPVAADALAHRRIRGPGRAANQPSPVSLQKTFRTLTLCRCRWNCLLRLWDYGHKGVAVDHIDEAWKRAVKAGRRAADAIERSAGLAEDHARRAKADGDHELAERERAHANHAREVVAEMRGRDTAQWLPS